MHLPFPLQWMTYMVSGYPWWHTHPSNSKQGGTFPTGTQHIARIQICSREQYPGVAAMVTGFFRTLQKSITTSGSLCHWLPLEVKHGNLVNYLYSRITKTTFSFSEFPEACNCSSPAFYTINTFISNVKETICLWVYSSFSFKSHPQGEISLIQS